MLLIRVNDDQETTIGQQKVKTLLKMIVLVDATKRRGDSTMPLELVRSAVSEAQSYQCF